MNDQNALRISALVGAAAVGLGAFGAHGLEPTLVANNTRTVWETAALYHLVHAVLLVVLALHAPLRRVSWWLFVAGIVIFSGTLYTLAITNVRWLGAITPIGGVALIAGWLSLFLPRRS